MELTSNIEKVIAQLKEFRQNAVSGAFSDALAGGLKVGEALLKRRIFNPGHGFDAEGITLGPYYSKQWKRIRAKAGRQVIAKDLDFTDDLRLSIQTVTVDNNTVQLRITNDFLTNIAYWQEIQIANLRAGRKGNAGGTEKANIFKLSTDELEIVRKNTRDLLNQSIQI